MRRRRRVVLPCGHVLADALAQRHAAAVAEVLAGLPGLGVEGDQLRVDGAREDAPAAGSAPLLRGVRRPVGDPAADARVGPLELPRPLARVEGPALAAALGIEGDHAVVAGAEDQRAVHHERRGVERGAGGAVASVGAVAVAVLPGELEVRDVGARDLGERRPVEAALVAGVLRPLRGGPRPVEGRALFAGRGEGGAGEQREAGGARHGRPRTLARPACAVSSRPRRTELETPRPVDALRGALPALPVLVRARHEAVPPLRRAPRRRAGAPLRARAGGGRGGRGAGAVLRPRGALDALGGRRDRALRPPHLRSLKAPGGAIC